MLSAAFLASCSDDIVKIYAELEEEILTDMARRLAKMGESPASTWQAQIYKDIGGVGTDIKRIISKYDAETQKTLLKLFDETLSKSEKKDMSLVKDAKRYMTANQRQLLETMLKNQQSTPMVYITSKQYKTIREQIALEKGIDIDEVKYTEVRDRVLKSSALNTFSNLSRLTQTIASTGQTQFTNAVNKAYMKTMTGAFSWDTSIKQAINELTMQGLYTVEYTDSGRVINRSVEAAVRMNVMTGLNKQATRQTLANCDTVDSDLVEVSAHMDARDVDVDGRPWANHAAWQGKVYCLNGERDYLDEDGNTRHAYNFYDVCHPDEVDGIGGINCRHSFYPYFEGSHLLYQDDLDEYQNTVTLNGKEMSQYQAEQKLRAVERTIRKYKRVYQAQSVFDKNSAEAKRALGKVRQWQGAARDICQQTGIRRDYTREYIGKI